MVYNIELEIVKTAPDNERARYSLDMADGFLFSAKEKLSNKDYGSSIEDARNAICLASAAIMFKDGYISSTFEGTLSYLSQHYPGKLPLDEWNKVEFTIISRGGVYDLLNTIVKKTREQQSKKAFETASIFVNVTRQILI